MAEEGKKPYSEGEETKGEETKLKKWDKGAEYLDLNQQISGKLLASLMAMTSFKYLGCYDFCDQIQVVQNHAMLTRLFISKLHDNKCILYGVTFTLSTIIISTTTGIINVGRNGLNKVSWRNITLSLS